MRRMRLDSAIVSARREVERRFAREIPSWYDEGEATLAKIKMTTGAAVALSAAFGARYPEVAEAMGLNDLRMRYCEIVDGLYADLERRAS